LRSSCNSSSGRSRWRLTFPSDERPPHNASRAATAGAAGPGPPRDAGRARDLDEVASRGCGRCLCPRQRLRSTWSTMT
jgi:hypothetical protein